MTDVDKQYRDPKSLYKWSKILILTSIVMHIIGVASGFMEYQLLTQILNADYAYISDEAFEQMAESNDLREMIIGFVQILLFIVQGIVILMWIYRANKNLRALGATNMRFSPGWSVGWYFVPLLSLWKPYQAMKEIFLKSKELSSNTTGNKSLLLPAWWALWIITEIIGQIIWRYIRNGNLEVEDYLTMSLFNQFADVLEIVLNIVFLLIITAVHQWQQSYKNQLSKTSTLTDMIIKN